MSWLHWSTPTFLDHSTEAVKALVLSMTGATLVACATVPLLMHDLSVATSWVVWAILVTGHLMIAWYLPILLEERRKVNHAVKPLVMATAEADTDVLGNSLLYIPSTQDAA